MKKHEQLMLIAAKSNIPVLLQGESGVGKEIAAKFIHEHSPRNEGPFVALNCGAIARNLAESLLEGAKKGSYTGAASDHQGIVQAANGGTLFLDEIGEMPFDMQSKLLRILQEHSVLPLGATQNEPVDFRLICATNRDLQNEIHSGNKWEIRALSRYDWPGNIRQLKNVLQRYALLRQHEISLEEILSEEFSHQTINDIDEHYTYSGTRASAPNWQFIQKALYEHNGNKSRAAKALKISRGCLCYQIKKHELREWNSCEKLNRPIEA